MIWDNNQPQMNLLISNPDKFWKNTDCLTEFCFLELRKGVYLGELVIPSNIRLDPYAFSYCDCVDKVVLPNDMEEIINNAFSDCDIKTIVLPQNLRQIKYNAFSRCKNLKTIEFNDSLTYIGDFAFQECPLKSVAFPQSLKSIGEYAFYNCKQLENIEFVKKESYFDESIGENAFFGCENLKNIKIGNVHIQLKEKQKFESLSKNTLQYFIVVFNEGEKRNVIITDGNQSYTIKNWPYKQHDINNYFIEELLFWLQTKQQSSSKTVQNSVLPKKYIIEALGKNKELINAYYSTKSNGVDLLEKRQWFQSLKNLQKTSFIHLFGYLGGFEDNSNHQKRVLEFLDKMVETLTSKMGDEWKYSICNEFFDSINLDVVKEKVTIYAHDENNKVIIENGFPKIKTEKLVKYHKQILSLLEKSLDHEKFLRFLPIITKEYSNIYKTYRKTLAKLNPMRNPNSTKEKYDEFKKNGITMDFVIEYFTQKNFVVKNEELKSVILDLQKSAQNQEIISIYDEYLTEAKQITSQAISKNNKIKVFAENVVDNCLSRLKYFWTPITSVVALTIGDRFDTCYRVDGMNEAGLVNVITNPQDWIFLVMNEKNMPIAYCRVSYDDINKGILIDNIEIDKHIDISDQEKMEIWQTCVRALKDMKVAMNKEGKYPVERINCKPDPYNKIFGLVHKDYPKYSSIKAKKLQEREYQVSEERNLRDSYYYSKYDGRIVKQIVIDSPELDNQK